MYQSARTALALLAAAAMTLGLARPAAADPLDHLHFYRGSATARPGSVCVESYVEPAVGVAAVRLDIAVGGVVRDSVTTTLAGASRGYRADSIDYARCFDVAAGTVAVAAVATVNPDANAGRPVTVPVIDRMLEVTAKPRPTAPAAPRKPSLQAAGASSIKVGWSKVHDGGGGAPAYEVRVTRGATVVRTLTTSGTSVTVPGLKLHAVYSVTLRAKNRVGSSAASPTAGIRLEAPGRPAKPSAASGTATSVKIAWTAPKSGGPTTGYQVRVFRGSKLVTSVSVAADKRSATVSGLEGGTRYGVEVRAKNGVGSSASSARASVRTKDWSAAARWAGKKFGTFPTVTVSGTGNEVVTLPRGATAGLVTARHSGTAGFAVDLQDKHGSQIDRLVNGTGAYSGTTVFGMYARPGAPQRLKVTASGDWTIRIGAVRTAAELPASAKGDGVYLYAGGTRRLSATHTGNRNFSVLTYASGFYGYNHLVNAVGGYRGTVPFRKGPAVVEVVADGSWTAKLR
jgi:hypothetical protein